ncbi:MAG: HEAT repeat domain-containing protein, partial [Acidobacteria bacterium]|nr:HEAT repeat domain-containing protein [Acidobacteriota bacterium]
FADQLKWGTLRIGWINFVFLFCWVAAAVVARKQYVVTLRESVKQHRLDVERSQTSVLDRSTSEILAENFSTSDPKEILYALTLFEVERERAVHPAVRGLLMHPAPEVRARAISILAQSGDVSIEPDIRKLMRDPVLEVRTEALLYLTHHSQIDPLARIQELGDFPDFSIRSAIVSFLARPGETQNIEAARVLFDTMVFEKGEEGRRTRLEAARLIGELPDHFEEQLRQLLIDEDTEIQWEAIRSVGKLRKTRFVSRLLEFLGRPELREASVDALSKFGDIIVGTLTDHLGDRRIPLETRREIPSVLVKTGSTACAKALVDNLIEGDTTLRFRILSAMNKLRHVHPGLEFDPLQIETVLIAEILGHYRSYQILGTLGAEIRADEPVARSLHEAMTQEVERIFRLLGLLYPKYDLHSAYFGIQSKDPVVHDNSLEFIDNVMKPQMRQMLVPLLDSAVTMRERVAFANKMVGAEVESQEEAVGTLVASPDPWLKSCGAYAIGVLKIRSLAHALDECLTHADPLLRETARQAKLRLTEE